MSQKRMDHLTALPSVSCSLSSLPHAKGLDQVKLHHPTLGSNLPAQEAKLRKALSVTSQNLANGQQTSSLPAVSAHSFTFLFPSLSFSFSFAPALPAPLLHLSRDVPRHLLLLHPPLSLSTIIISRNVATHASIVVHSCTRREAKTTWEALSFLPARVYRACLCFPYPIPIPEAEIPMSELSAHAQSLVPLAARSSKPRFTSTPPSLLAYLVHLFYAAHAGSISFPFPLLALRQMAICMRRPIR
ncbi:hypothetical protein ACEPAH_7595 [Sanghuangporus vaninii]